MDAAGFRRYLEHDYRSAKGTPLSGKAAGDTVSRCRRIEQGLGLDLDALVKDGNAEEAAARITAQRLGGHATEAVVRDCRTAVRRYFSFRRSQRAKSRSTA